MSRGSARRPPPNSSASTATWPASAPPPTPFSKLTPARRKNILEGAAYLDVAPTIVRVATDAPLSEFDPVIPCEPLDPMALEELSARWGLGTSLTRLLDTLTATR